MSAIKTSAPTAILAIFSLIAVAALAAALLTIPMQASAQSDTPDWRLPVTGLTAVAGDDPGEMIIS
jgi:hypothetical protein